MTGQLPGRSSGSPHTTALGKLRGIHPVALTVIVTLWLGVLCGLPLWWMDGIRRQARTEMSKLLLADQEKGPKVLAIFDRANRNLDLAAFRPCLILAVLNIFLARRLLSLGVRSVEPPAGVPAPRIDLSERDWGKAPPK